jgi:1-phosphatidylinositol phosphodiesterase
MAVYHGPRPQRSSLPVLLDVLHTFLQEHPTETFILCLKEESPPFHPQFSRLVYSYFKPHCDKWFLENRIPKLGEVRGKGILMTRFPDDHKDWISGLGIHPYTWPNSRKEGFDWDCDGTRFRIQDWYDIPTFLEIPEKFQTVSSWADNVACKQHSDRKTD